MWINFTHSFTFNFNQSIANLYHYILTGQLSCRSFLWVRLIFLLPLKRLRAPSYPQVELSWHQNWALEIATLTRLGQPSFPSWHHYNPLHTQLTSVSSLSTSLVSSISHALTLLLLFSKGFIQWKCTPVFSKNKMIRYLRHSLLKFTDQ